MQPSPLHLVSHTHYYRGGDVIVDATAAVGPGAVFRAAPHSSIRVEAGVCIGAGTVLHAKGGALVIHKEASLGASSVVMGHGQIGAEACIGPSSTLINPQVSKGTVVPPCTLVKGSGFDGGTQPAAASQAGAESAVPSVPIEPRSGPTIQPQEVAPRAVKTGGDTGEASDRNGSTGALANNNGQVYGRAHVDSLLSALFPHRQPLNNGQSTYQEDD